MPRFAPEAPGDWTTLDRPLQPSGGFFPGNLLSLSLVTSIAGSAPAFFLAVNAAVFAATAAGPSPLVRLRGGADLEAGVSAVWLVRSGPAAAVRVAFKQALPGFPRARSGLARAMARLPRPSQ
jgi:hypothetical protein